MAKWNSPFDPFGDALFGDAFTWPDKEKDEPIPDSKIVEWCPRCDSKNNYILNYQPENCCWKCGYPELKDKK